MYKGKYYFETENFKLIKDDVFKAIKKIDHKSIDIILLNNKIKCYNLIILKY